jgi:hypothetical protein
MANTDPSLRRLSRALHQRRWLNPGVDDRLHLHALHRKLLHRLAAGGLHATQAVPRGDGVTDWCGRGMSGVPRD